MKPTHTVRRSASWSSSCNVTSFSLQQTFFAVSLVGNSCGERSAHCSIGSMVVKAKSAAAVKRQETLNLKRLRYEQQQQAKLDLWCTEHDADGNGEFDRAEITTLLNALYPEHTLGEDMLDQLMERATGVYTSSLTLRGDKNGRVTKKALFKTVSQYECCEPQSVPRGTHALAARISSH